MPSHSDKSRRKDPEETRPRAERSRSSRGSHSSERRGADKARTGYGSRTRFDDGIRGRSEGSGRKRPDKGEVSKDRAARSHARSGDEKRASRKSSNEEKAVRGRHASQPLDAPRGRHRRVVDTVPEDTDNFKAVSPKKAASAKRGSSSGKRKLNVNTYYKNTRHRLPVGPIAAFVILALIGVIAASANSDPGISVEIGLASQGIVATGQPQQEEGVEASDDGSKVEVSFDPSSIDMSQLPESTGLSEFSFAGTETVVADSTKTAINNALSPFKSGNIPVGFVFANLDTGHGIAYNVDEQVYGASSIKGPFMAYICEEQVDGGKVAMTNSYKTYDESYNSSGSASLEDLIQMTIEQSSNGSLMALVRQFGDSSYDSWLQSNGVSPGIYQDDGFFAWYTARDAAKLWNGIHNYLGENTAASNALYGMMSNTNVSYIRNSLDSLAEGLEKGTTTLFGQKSASKIIRVAADRTNGSKTPEQLIEDAVVVNKAGWCASDVGEGTKYDSVSDNGIVTIGDDDYLLCIMSGARYSDTNEKNVENLATAILSGYTDLQ